MNKEPDPCGLMEMRNLADSDPDSPTFGQVVYARAKGLFAKSNERWIQIKFEYLFTDPAGGAALMIYLSDIPELPGRDDPVRRQHYLEVARLLQPPAGRPGSAASARWGVFDKVVSVKNLNFVRDTRIELELIGPAGACVWINNWDPAIRCYTSTCGDVAGAYEQVDEIDFLAALSECGRRIDADISCLDGFFCADGYVTVHDAMAVDWNDVTQSLCPDEWLGSESQSAAYASYASTSLPRASAQRVSIAAVQTQDVAFVQEVPGQFLVAAKGYRQPNKTAYDFRSDRLYGLDADGTVVSGPFSMSNDDGRCNAAPVVDDNARYNGKLVRDHSGTVYQVNLERGLVRIADNKLIVAPRSFLIDREDRYDGPATVSIGLRQTEDGSWGRPLLDAAFDAQGRVYVVPVVVDPALGKPYVVAARLKLTDTGQGADYSIEQLYDDPPAPNDNYVLTQLREVEVDQAGNVYVLNCHRDNNSDILWVYGSDDQLAHPCELQKLGITAPTGLCVSSYDASKLYLASCENQPDANSVKLYVLSSQDLSLSHTIEIRNMGHITDIAEDPATGTICVVGFQMPTIPSESQIQDADNILAQEPFYKPRVATIRSGDDGPFEAVRPTGDATTDDMALPLSVIWAGETIGSRNEAH